MKVIQLKITSALLAAIALAIIPFMPQGGAMEEVECPDEFDGVELSDRQKSELKYQPIAAIICGEGSVGRILFVRRASEAIRALACLPVEVPLDPMHWDYRS